MEHSYTGCNKKEKWSLAVACLHELSKYKISKKKPEKRFQFPWVVIIQVAIIHGGSFLAWQFSRVAIFLGGNCPDGNLPQEVPGWQFSPGGNFPRVGIVLDPFCTHHPLNILLASKQHIEASQPYKKL